MLAPESIDPNKFYPRVSRIDTLAMLQRVCRSISDRRRVDNTFCLVRQLVSIYSFRIILLPHNNGTVFGYTSSYSVFCENNVGHIRSTYLLTDV